MFNRIGQREVSRECIKMSNITISKLNATKQKEKPNKTKYRHLRIDCMCVAYIQDAATSALKRP